MQKGLYLGFWGFGMSVEGVSDGGVGDWISGERVVGLRKSRDPRHGVGVESRKIPCSNKSLPEAPRSIQNCMFAILVFVQAM